MLVVVHTQELGLLGSTELQARNHVDGLGQDGRHDESVGAAGDNVGDLDVHELVVAVNPAARDSHVDTVEADNRARGEEGVEDETNNTADTVLGEDIERVVDLEEKFD